MKFTTHLLKTRRDVAAEIESVNGKLLSKANFIHQELAGAYTFMPLGLLTLRKIEDIIRKHINEIGSEILMTSLHPRANWETTGRLETVDVLFSAAAANETSRQKSSNNYILGSTHEEIVTPLVQEFVQSYKDLPVAVYQIQTKFRNEARAKSGLLRGREFRMKDLYSFHATTEDLYRYYEIAKQKYLDIFAELGLGDITHVTLASGGDFTSDFSHEFQTIIPSGEDTIYIDDATGIAYNKEVVTEENSQKLGIDFSKLRVEKAAEVGNIFPLHTKFSEAFKFTFADNTGKLQPVYMGCYGIGPSRLMGVIVERFHDEAGMIWPENVAPFKYHLVTDNTPEALAVAEKFYADHAGDVLWDDRADKSIGEKLHDADLIGLPHRYLISKRSLEKGGIEAKKRNETEVNFIAAE